MNLSSHIVIVPDGNRRWAENKGLPSFFGHREGAKTTEKILKTAMEMKIPHFTFWGCSLNNVIKRPKKEVDFLFGIFEKHFEKLAKNREVHKNGVKIDVIGRWRKIFPERVKKAIEKAIEKTKDYKNYRLTFLMAYSGVDEMTAAIQKITQLKIKDSKFEIDEKTVKENLWTKDLPPVDLVIRTGGEPHWSAGLMMWDVAEAQLYFTKTLWPDFSENEFKKTIEKYSETERRMGQ